MEEVDLPVVSGGEEQQNPQIVPRSKKYNNIEWTKQNTFESPEAMTIFFAANKHWKKRDERADTTGRKTRFYCNVTSRSKGRACPAEIMVHAVDNALQSILYTNAKAHVHDGEDQKLKSVPVSPEIRQKIKSMLETKMKPRMMYIALQKDDTVIPKPTTIQVNNY